MQFGLDIAQQRMPWAELASRARFAEELGFDGVWGFDHFQPMYGDGPGECFEGNTTLAALSGLTERVRLGLLVTGMTYRHPAVFAAEAITIDHASGGRLELSYGAAWFDPEHTALGIPYPGTKERVDGFEEAVQIVRGLLTTDDFTFEGKHFSVHDATLRPRPVQQPHPPMWIGASGEQRMMPIAARYADVWHCFGALDDLTAKSARISAYVEAAGRDPSDIRRVASLSIETDLDGVARMVEAWEAAGFEYLVCGWPSEGRELVEQFARRILGRPVEFSPELRDGVAAGRITLSFRLWTRPQVKVGGRYSTRSAVIEIDDMELVPFSTVTAADVRRCGEENRETLRARTAHAGPVTDDTLVYRIEFHVVGDAS